MTENCIIIFIKYPEHGKVKSRLAKDLGDNLALEIYQTFVYDLLSLLAKTNYDFKIAYYPPEAGEKVKNWLGYNYNYLPQKGDDLGEKMKNTFIDIFNEGYKKALIIGSDSPDLNKEIFDEAFFSLKEVDAVIGSAFDGGYYLIGFNKNRFLPKIFDNILWSSSSVFQDTMKIFEKYYYNTHNLKKWRDIDTFDDLKALVEGKNTDFDNSKTIRFLKQNVFNE